MHVAPPTMTIRFDANPQEIDARTILRLPEPASRKLPSRGQVACAGTINQHPFETVIEPDGEFGHWMRIDGDLQKAADLRTGVAAHVEIEPAEEWPEPTVPPDLRRALSNAPGKIRDLWESITPMARWEWVRWVNATRNRETRERRVAVSLSKLGAGKRRPCCFNLASCTDPDLAKNGKLLPPQSPAPGLSRPPGAAIETAAASPRPHGSQAVSRSFVRRG